jgi:hypothetical protein
VVIEDPLASLEDHIYKINLLQLGRYGEIKIAESPTKSATRPISTSSQFVAGSEVEQSHLSRCIKSTYKREEHTAPNPFWKHGPWGLTKLPAMMKTGDGEAVSFPVQVRMKTEEYHTRIGGLYRV